MNFCVGFVHSFLAMVLGVRNFLIAGSIDFIGAPERIRTSDLCLRRAALYPAELRARSKRCKFTLFVDITNGIIADLAKLS